MVFLRTEHASKAWRSNRWLDKAQELVKLFVGICAVVSLIIMQGQICPTASAAETNMMVICKADGFAVVTPPGTEQNKNETCNRCPDCQTCSNNHMNEPNRTSLFVPSITSELAAMPAYVTLLVDLPDHLLPFSGAPPPEKLDQTMLHTLNVPVRLASTQIRTMPEAISWR